MTGREQMRFKLTWLHDKAMTGTHGNVQLTIQRD